MMIDNTCVPYQRKGLYLALTIPMILVYVAIAIILWRVSIILFGVYASLFVCVALFMSYVCVYWECPYVGRFAPCVGGFCLPSSQIARLFRHARRSEKRYNLSLTLAYASFFGIILFPMYFLYLQGVLYLLAYVGIAVVYGAAFTLFICPVCGTRHVCPGGQVAMALQEKIGPRR